VAALQSEEIRLVEGIKADIALGTPFCHWNYSDIRFNLCRRNGWPYRVVKLKIFISKLIN
jgi:hypothetical protein